MIGKNITRIRESKGYTLSQLAELANISKSYLSNIERGINKNPSISVMQKIAAVLNVNLSTLLKGSYDIGFETCLEKEWVDFFKELKELGIQKEEVKKYKPLIEFIKWQKENSSNK